MKRIRLMLTVCFFLLLSVSMTGCNTTRNFIIQLMAPSSFVITYEPSWSSIELRDNISYEKAWHSVTDRVVRNFEIEVMSMEDGYLRTNWLYTWTGEINTNYRVRLTVKFNPERTNVDIKSEAEYGGPGSWTPGYDTRLLQTMKTDIMGTIGRATR